MNSTYCVNIMKDKNIGVENFFKSINLSEKAVNRLYLTSYTLPKTDKYN